MILSSYGQCKQLNISFWWWCRGVGNLAGMENCSHSRWHSLCLGSCTLPMGVSSHRISLYWKRTGSNEMLILSRILRIPQWDNISKSCNPGLQSRMENMTWILLACLLPRSMNEGVNAEIGWPWVVKLQLTIFLAPCILQHIMYITMYIDPTLFPRSNHHQLPNLIPIFHKMIFFPKLQLAI